MYNNLHTHFFLICVQPEVGMNSDSATITSIVAYQHKSERWDVSPTPHVRSDVWFSKPTPNADMDVGKQSEMFICCLVLCFFLQSVLLWHDAGRQAVILKREHSAEPCIKRAPGLSYDRL